MSNPADNVKNSAQFLDSSHLNDKHDGLYTLRFIQTHTPIQAIITVISPTDDPDFADDCFGKYKADIYEGAFPDSPTHDNATKQDVYIYDIDSNQDVRAIGDQVTVWMMPNHIGVINPIQKVSNDLGEYDGMVDQMEGQRQKGWGFVRVIDNITE